MTAPNFWRRKDVLAWKRFSLKRRAESYWLTSTPQLLMIPKIEPILTLGTCIREKIGSITS